MEKNIMKTTKHKIFLWGTGYIADQILSNTQIFERFDIVGFIDNDPIKQGKEYKNRPVYGPEILQRVQADKIVILTLKYQDIYRQITQNYQWKNTTIENWRYFERQITAKPKILKRYKNTEDPGIRKAVEYISQHDLEVFNDSFKEKYRDIDISVSFDKGCGMFYVLHQGKKMYFAKSLDTEMAVINYYKGILMEQDNESPHKYTDDEFQVCSGDVVIDAGVAEGNFALEIIDKVSKIYLIESNCEWVEALQETFQEYQDKVVIVQKYVTSLDDGDYATLDSLINEPVNFIKMDIEGNEWDALLGAEKLIKQSKRIKCAICSYHCECDEILIRAVLTQYGLQCTTTLGYMWFASTGRDGEMSSKLLRGIVRGVK